MGTAEGEAALAMLGQAGDYARSNDSEKDLDALSEKELELLAMDCNKLLGPSCSTSDMRNKLQSYRSVVSRDPNQHVRLGGTIDAIRAKMKLKHMQSKGQHFQKQAQRQHRSQSQRCAEALQNPAGPLLNPATAQHLQPGFSQQLQAERQPAQTQAAALLKCINCQQPAAEVKQVEEVALCNTCWAQQQHAAANFQDAPIVLDSDEDEDDGVLAVADGAAAAAAADDGSTDSEAAAAANARRRRSQRINLVTAGPGTTQKFLGLRCLFPSAGGRGAVEVVAEDLARLDPDEFLNDTIIDYYIKKIELSLPPDGRRRCHFFNSFFFKKLTEKTANCSGNGRGARKADQEEVARQNWERVKKWTKGVDIFQKDFLFVPIHDVLHWSLAIICHPALLPEVAAASRGGEAAGTAWDRLPAAQAAAAAAEARATAAAATASGGSQLGDEQLGHQGPESAGAAAVAAVTAATFGKRPVILHLDSMSSGHTSPAVGRALGQYLEQEWAHRHGLQFVQLQLICAHQPLRNEMRSWFHPALASVLRGQLRFELLELMIAQERDEYKQQWDEQQQRLRNNTPGGILAYVVPAQYRAAHQLLDRHLQLQEAEKSAARRASKSRQQQQQLKLEQLALDEPRQLTNAERRRDTQRAAAASAAEQQEGPAAGVRGDQAVAEVFPGPEVDMQGEEEEDEERERFYSPEAEFEEDEKGKESNGARPADSDKHSSRHHSTLAGKDPEDWQDGTAVQGVQPTCSGGAPADGAVAAAAAIGAAEDVDMWQPLEDDASEDADDIEVKPSARKARAAAEQRQRRQLRQSKRRRTSEQQQRQQSDVHPEQEEDAIDEDAPLAQVVQRFLRAQQQQQQQQTAENRQSQQVRSDGATI
eukprot:gene10667-10826_t